ncbi:Heat stress transcription factor [Trichinella spiralis]|uniref:Heat stress transcription factor n=1 Tax=Trichinella spiralis TaxID=6334 RepID=A0ABR3KL05_TRISP
MYDNNSTDSCNSSVDLACEPTALSTTVQDKIKFFYNLESVVYMYLVFGCTGFLTNGAWAITLILNKEKHRIKKYFTAYALACSMKTFTIALEYARIIYYFNSDSTVSALYCFVFAIHPTLYLSADLIIVSILLFMAIDFLLTISIIKTHWQLTRRFAFVVGLILFIALLMTVITSAWLISVYDSTEISIMCILTDVVAPKMIILNIVLTLTISIAATGLLLVAMIRLRLQKRVTENNIQVIQLRRNSIAVNKIFIITFFTLAIHSIPFVAAMASMIENEEQQFWDFIVWLLHNVAFTVHGLFRIWRTSNLCIRCLPSVHPVSSIL